LCPARFKFQRGHALIDGNYALIESGDEPLSSRNQEGDWSRFLTLTPLSHQMLAISHQAILRSDVFQAFHHHPRSASQVAEKWA